MTISELDSFIKESLNSEDNLRDFIFLPPLENRLTDLLAARLNNGDTIYKAITEYPFKDRTNPNPTGKASLIDLVCFNKDDKRWNNEKILWALETKLYSPHQTKDQDRYISMSMGGPNKDREKLRRLKIKQFFILLFQFEITRIPNTKKSIESILECYPLVSYLGNSLEKINKHIEEKAIKLTKDKIQALRNKCVDTFGLNNTKYDCSGEIAIGEGDTQFGLKIHYILNEDSFINSNHN